LFQRSGVGTHITDAPASAGNTCCIAFIYLFNGLIVRLNMIKKRRVSRQKKASFIWCFTVLRRLC